MRFCWRLIFAVILFAVCRQRINAAESLQWKLKPAQVLHYQMQQETQTRTSAKGRDLAKSTVQQTVDQTWQVKEIDTNGTATIGMTFDRIVVKYDTPEGVMQVDTSGKMPGIGQFAAAEAALKSFTNAELTVVMTPSGEITGVTLPEAIKRDLVNRKVAEPLQASFTEEGLKSMIAQGSVLLPKQPIEQGETWTDEKDNAGFKLKLTYKLIGPQKVAEQTLDQVEIAGDMRFERQPIPNVTLKIVQQDVKGSLSFNSQAGYLQSMEFQQRSAIDITTGNTTARQDIQLLVSNKRKPADAEAASAADATAP